MLVRYKKNFAFIPMVGKALLALTFVVALNSSLAAQTAGFLGDIPVVGGVEINPDGVLQARTTSLNEDLKELLRRGVSSIDTDMTKSGMRMISLKALESKIIEYKNADKKLLIGIRYLAGLQRVEYVFLSPDDGDVIIGGPGEGLKTDENGNVVGSKSGMPPISLEDFLVAMRCVQNARQGYGISVSIDPTEQGVRNVRKLLKNVSPSQFNQQTAVALEEACGEQVVTLTGVPEDSRFSTVLVSADYKMKRLAMGLEQAPEFLPSILHMAKSKNVSFGSISPRFWMETAYEPMSVSDDKRVWKLNGQGVCTKTQESRTKNGKSNKLATQWAEKMTSRYDDLCKVEPVFRELRNLMDLSVVAAVIARENMLQKAGLEIPAIQGNDMIALPSWNAPRKVPTQCSYTFLPSSMIVTTSGGVTIDSWKTAANVTNDSSLAKFTDLAQNRSSERWWWNAN